MTEQEANAILELFGAMRRVHKIYNKYLQSLSYDTVTEKDLIELRTMNGIIGESAHDLLEIRRGDKGE